jgi:hypothetical protein
MIVIDMKKCRLADLGIWISQVLYKTIAVKVKTSPYIIQAMLEYLRIN